MSVKDIKSQLQSNVAFIGEVTSDVVTNGAIIDNADYDLGIMFIVQAVAYTDGTYNFAIEESDDSGMAGRTMVPADKIIGDITSLEIDAANTSGDLLGSVGVFSNKRYLRMIVVSTGVTTGATISAVVVQSGEIVPV